MEPETRVISGDLDGTELRREKRKCSRYSRCDGKDDHEELQDALDHGGRRSWSIPGELWDRIFGRGK